MKPLTAGFKHQGRYRPHNEDNFLILDEAGLYAVADGVESEPAGEVASSLCVTLLGDIIKDLNLEADATPPFEYAEGLPLPVRALKFAFREINRKIYEQGQSDPKFKGMASTLTVIWLHGGRVYIGNVGDSRAYLLRGGHIQQLTHDHTPLAQGSSAHPVRIDFAEDFSSTSGHELTRAMGLNPDLEVQLAGGTPKPGDVFLLCTDGLYQDVRDFEILDAVKAFPPDHAARKLITLANQRGGKDNIAVVVVQIP